MKHITMIWFVSFFFPSFAQQLDTTNSWVTFSITKMNNHEVVGTIGGMQGKLYFQNDLLSGIDICIQPATVETDNGYRDRQLQKANYFDVANHPKICFISDSIQKTELVLVVFGKLAMLGVTRQEAFTLTRTAYGFEGKTTINWMDYNLGGEPIFKIGEEVKITVHCALIEE